MTDIQHIGAATTDGRGQLQRRLRAQRRDGPYQATIALCVTLALVLVGGWSRTTEADPVNPDEVAAIDPKRDDALFTATMVGDMMFARSVEVIVQERGYESLFRNVRPLLEGDYVSGNLETVVSDDPDLPEAGKLIFLRSPTSSAAAIADAGFTTVSMANNHAMDYGIPGLADTIEAVDGAGLERAGAGVDLGQAKTINYQTFPVEGGEDFTVATLSFTDAFVSGFIARAFQGGVLSAEPDTFAPMIVEADANADLVIVNFHFGEEYDNGPSARQRELVEVASTVGADVIIGHHPHVALSVEQVGDTLVMYSLGNFIFDQGWSRTRESVIARYGLDRDGTAHVELIPIYIEEGTPRVIEGVGGVYRRARIFQRVKAGSTLQWRREGPSLVADFDQSAMLAEERQ